jgi:hypothetical protein
MLVTYAPDQGSKQQWEWDADRVRTSEAELCEKRFGDTWDKLKVGIMSGQSKARRVLLWHLLRREQHTLRYEDVPDFYVGELLVEFTREELQAMRTKIERARMDETERDEMLTAIDLQIADAPSAGEPVGKATSNTSGDDTSGP